MHAMAVFNKRNMFILKPNAQKGIKVKYVHKISVKSTKTLTAVPSHTHKPQQMAALHVHTW